MTVSIAIPLSSWLFSFNGNGHIAAEAEVQRFSDCNDEPLIGFRIAAILLPVSVGQSVLKEPLPSSCWNLSGEIVRELFFVFCSYFFKYTPYIVFREYMVATVSEAMLRSV